MNTSGLMDFYPLGTHKHPCTFCVDVYTCIIIEVQTASYLVDPLASSNNLYLFHISIVCESVTDHQTVSISGK